MYKNCHDHASFFKLFAVSYKSKKTESVNQQQITSDPGSFYSDMYETVKCDFVIAYVVYTKMLNTTNYESGLYIYTISYIIYYVTFHLAT